MSLSAAPVAPYSRLIAVITLGHGLMDCALMLGLFSPVSPVNAYGPDAFWALVAFVLMRLFAAVGLWTLATWGAVLVIAANAGEIIFAMMAPNLVSLGIIGFAVRLIVLSATILLLVFERYLRHLRANEL